jgi:hypothetical protein
MTPKQPAPIYRTDPYIQVRLAEGTGQRAEFQSVSAASQWPADLARYGSPIGVCFFLDIIVTVEMFKLNLQRIFLIYVAHRFFRGSLMAIRNQLTLLTSGS